MTSPTHRIIDTGKPAPFDRNLITEIREGDKGTDDTIAAMIAVAQYAAAKDRRRLLSLLNGVTSPQGVYKALRDRVVFKPDPERLELVPAAAQMLSAIQQQGKARGDCDDRATLGLALMLAVPLNWPCIVVCGTDPTGDFQHVYCGYALRAGARGDFTPETIDIVWGIDPQENTPPGKHPAAARFRVYPVNQEGL